MNKFILAATITTLLFFNTLLGLAENPIVPDAPESDGLVYIIPVHNMIEPALLYVIRRGVAEANQKGADIIVFSMDTPGGTLDAAGKIIRIIQDIDVPTATFVEKDAYSAGAIIALATDDIYMAPGSVIGDAMPIMMSPMGGVKEMPEAIQEKMVSGVAAKIRSAAEHGGHDKELAEAMVRRGNVYKIGDKVICPEGELLTLTNVEAEQLVGDDQHRLLSAGTVKSINELLKEKGLENAKRVTLEVTTSERIARFIAGLAPIFLMAGLLGVYIEIKTPGFGLPGLLGGLCLIIFFWGHHIAGLAGMEDMLVFMLGVTLLLIEVLVIPGFGFVGASGILLISWAVIKAMVEHYPGTPWYHVEVQDVSRAVVLFSISLVGTVLFAWLLAKLLPKTGLFNRLILSQTADAASGYTATTPHIELINQTGVVLSELRPAGTARIAGKKLDVVTQGDFIDAGVTIRVTDTKGSRIIVERET